MGSEMPFLYLDFKQKYPDLEPGYFQKYESRFLFEN